MERDSRVLTNSKVPAKTAFSRATLGQEAQPKMSFWRRVNQLWQHPVGSCGPSSGALLFAAVMGVILLAPAGFAAPTSAGSGSTAVQSLTDIDRETLLYGIDSQVLGLLSRLTSQPIPALDQDVVTVFKQSANPDVQTAAINYLRSVKDWSARDPAFALLQGYAGGGDQVGEVVMAVIRYLRDAKDAASYPLFAQLLSDPSKSIVETAVEALGKSGDPKYAAQLLSNLNSTDFPADIKPDLLLALGDLKAQSAVPALTKILKNADQSSIMRQYACYALGKIGDPTSLPVITQAYQDKDDYLRAYAVSALSGFSGARVDDLLMQALKDNFWRVRVDAAESLGARRVSAAVPILEYKAKFDPTLNVRVASITALGKIGDGGGYDFLRKLFANDLADPTLRENAFDSLVSNDLSGSLSTIEKVIDSLWVTQPQSPFLDYLCKQLSQAKDPGLKSLYVRFLDGPTINIIIYGIRGIVNNGFADLRPSVKALSAGKNAESVRENALTALSELK